MRIASIALLSSTIAAEYGYQFNIVGSDHKIRPYRLGNACAERKGNKVKLRACKNNAPAQQWSFDAETGIIKSLHGDACWQASASQEIRNTT